MSAPIVLFALFVAGLALSSLAAVVLLLVPSLRRYAGPFLGGYVCMGIGAGAALGAVLLVVLGVGYVYTRLSALLFPGSSPSESAIPGVLLMFAVLVATIVGGARGWRIGWYGMLAQPQHRGSA